MPASRRRFIVGLLSFLSLSLLFGAFIVARRVTAASTKPHADYVILLHGMGRTAGSMKRLEWELKRQGYRVINASYPSTSKSIESLADDWLETLIEQQVLDSHARVHFVTHSLGGILLRQHLATRQIKNIGRVVMLAPPNQGSELADCLKKNVLFRKVTGPAGQQLGTHASSVPAKLGHACFELGIIAGDRSLNPWFSHKIPGPDDGKVSVASTKLDGMQDFIVVHSSHTWLMWRKGVITQVVEFLKTGYFHKPHSEGYTNVGQVIWASCSSLLRCIWNNDLLKDKRAYLYPVLRLIDLTPAISRRDN